MNGSNGGSMIPSKIRLMSLEDPRLKLRSLSQGRYFNIFEELFGCWMGEYSDSIQHIMENCDSCQVHLDGAVENPCFLTSNM